MDSTSNWVDEWNRIWAEYFNPETILKDLNIKDYAWGGGEMWKQSWFVFWADTTPAKQITFAWENEEQMRKALSILKAQELEFFTKQYDVPIFVRLNMWEDEYKINNEIFKLT